MVCWSFGPYIIKDIERRSYVCRMLGTHNLPLILHQALHDTVWFDDVRQDGPEGLELGRLCNRMFNPGCLPCCFGFRGGACVQVDVPRAQLSSGTILGEYVGGSEHFCAVPFAAPPTGIRRWKKPEPVEPWLGELDCSSRRPEDDRRGRPVQSVDASDDRQPVEDCLHLDIWLPMGTLGSLARAPKGLPVLVWIYGGGLLSGSKDDPGSSGQCYAEQGIILICINYRVGALGFLCPRNGDPNCGLWDQVCALQWIQREIGNLGGDPKKVTIMGQSAGGDSVYWCEPPVPSFRL